MGVLQDDQVGDFVHIVLTVGMSRVNGWGWAKVFTGGELAASAPVMGT